MTAAAGATPARSPRPGSRSGFTLIEVVLSCAIISTILLSFTLSEHIFISRAQSISEQSEARTAARFALGEMEGDIRESEHILRAGTDVFEVETRYRLDADDGVERTLYTLSAGVLEKQVAQDGGAYGAATPLLTGVQAFSGRAFTLSDSFDASRYDGSLLSVGSRLADCATSAVYDVLGLGGLDLDFIVGYDAFTEHLDLSAPLLFPAGVTVTPPLDREGLAARVTFTPFVGTRDYRALIYGDESTAGDAVSIDFAADGKVRLARRTGGAVTYSVETPPSWVAKAIYVVELSFADGDARAWIQYLGGPQVSLGSVSAADLDSREIHFQVLPTGARGFFDDLYVRYDAIEVGLTVETAPGRAETFIGGATRRAR